MLYTHNVHYSASKVFRGLRPIDTDPTHTKSCAVRYDAPPHPRFHRLVRRLVYSSPRCRFDPQPTSPFSSRQRTLPRNVAFHLRGASLNSRRGWSRSRGSRHHRNASSCTLARTLQLPSRRLMKRLLFWPTFHFKHMPR